MNEKKNYQCLIKNFSRVKHFTFSRWTFKGEPPSARKENSFSLPTFFENRKKQSFAIKGDVAKEAWSAEPCL